MHMSTYLVHHGIKGMKWGVRRYQNADGSLTSAGRNRYGVLDRAKEFGKKTLTRQLNKAKQDSKRYGTGTIAGHLVVRRVGHSLKNALIGGVAVSALKAGEYKALEKGKSGSGYNTAARAVTAGFRAINNAERFNDWSRAITTLGYKYGADEYLKSQYANFKNKHN